MKDIVANNRLRFPRWSLLVGLLCMVISLSACKTTRNTSSPSPPSHPQMGHLSWPAYGEIKESFGTVVNPVYGTRVNNPGILIATPPRSAVQSASDGRVVDVYTMPEYGRVVIINHGDFSTLYGNLSAWDVSRGMEINTGQIIGSSGSDEDPKGESVFFAIFQDGVESDPVLWLRRE